MGQGFGLIIMDLRHLRHEVRSHWDSIIQKNFDHGIGIMLLRFGELWIQETETPTDYYSNFHINSKILIFWYPSTYQSYMEIFYNIMSVIYVLHFQCHLVWMNKAKNEDTS